MAGKVFHPLVAAAPNSADFIRNEAGGDQALVNRVVLDLDMRPAWRQVNLLAKRDDYLPYEFLQLAVALPRQWARMSKTSTAKAKEDVKEIERAVRALSRMLHARRPEVFMLVGYDTDLATLIRDALIAQGHEDVGNRVRDVHWEAIITGGSDGIPDLPDVLDVLATRLATAQRGRPIGGRPTRPGARDAERTYCVQQLAAFFEEKTERIPKSVIARTVTAILNLSSPMTPDHVTKLLKA